jgi:hypothetical protein
VTHPRERPLTSLYLSEVTRFQLDAVNVQIGNVDVCWLWSLRRQAAGIDAETAVVEFVAAPVRQREAVVPVTEAGEVGGQMARDGADTPLSADQAAPRFQAAFRAETSARAVSSASLRCSGPRPTPSARMNAASLMPMNPKKPVRNVS